MSSENKCMFCGSEITDNICGWCGFSAQAKTQLPGTLAYGTDINGFVVGNVTDMDGESTTYMAYDTHTQTKVVLKEFLPVSMVGPRNGNNVAVQQGKEVLFKNLMMDFTDLYSALSRIDSKNLQKTISIFSANGTVYVVLEYIKADSLRQNLIKRGKPYTFKEARWLFQDLFRLMALLEKNNIAHGGISDETVMVTPDGTVVLTGFAIRDLRVKNEHIMYKLYDGFSAPEQYSLDRFSGFYTDIYSLSALLYHIVTGRVFRPESLGLKDLGRYMPKYAIETLKHATKPNPRDRIDNIQDFVLMLDNKATMEKPKAEKPKQTPGTPQPDLNKKLWIVIAVLTVILFIVSGIALSATNGNSDTPSSSYEESESFVNQVTVPDLTGKTYSEIMKDTQLIKDFYISRSEEFSSRPVGEIISQQPLPHTSVSQGTIIYVTVSKGEEQVMVQMPTGLAGRPYEDALALLDAMGIRYVTKDVPQTRKYPTGTVAGTDIPEGIMIDPKETYVIVYVSDNTPLPE